MRLYLRLELLVICMVLACGVASAAYQTFTNEDGQEIEAELIQVSEDGSTVSIRLRNGREVDAVIAAFSSEDRKKIRDWWKGVQAERELLKPESRITASLKLNQKTQDRDSSGNYWYAQKEAVVAFYPQVTVQNDDALQTFKGNTVRAVVLARDKQYKDLVLVAAAFEKTSDFKMREETILDGQPFRLREYEHKDTYDGSYNYERGYEYVGYVVAIKNSKGEVVYKRATKVKYLSNMDNVLNCKSGQIYDEDFNHKLNQTPSSYYMK